MNLFTNILVLLAAILAVFWQSAFHGIRNLIGVQIPFWEEILDHSHRLAEVVPLKYVGIDVAISEKGPVVLEINARPGLDIQNVTACGMRPILEALR